MVYWMLERQPFENSVTNEIVLDAGVAFKCVVQEADSDKALQLRADYRNAIHELIAPSFFPFELRNALTKAEPPENH